MDSPVSVSAEYVSGYISTRVENVRPTIQVRTLPNQKPWVNTEVLHLLHAHSAAFRSADEVKAVQ